MLQQLFASILQACSRLQVEQPGPTGERQTKDKTKMDAIDAISFNLERPDSLFNLLN